MILDRLELAKHVLKEKYSNKLNFWLYYFLIENEKLCEKYKIKNKDYNFYFYMAIEGQYRLIKDDFEYEINTDCNFFNELYLHIMSHSKNPFVSNLRIYNPIYVYNEFETKLLKFYKNNFDWVNSSEIFECNCCDNTSNTCISCKMVIEFYNLYNLKKISPARKYKNIR